MPSAGSRSPGSLLPLLIGVATTSVVAVAMAFSRSPWTLALDAGTSFLGQTVPAFRSWTAGRVPEWSDLLWGGFPLIAEPTTAALYPPHVVAFLATTSAPLRFFDVALALHVGLLAAGSAMLVGTLGAGVAAIVFAGLLAPLSPIGHGNAIANFASFGALAWLPWILTAAERLARPETPRLGRAMWLGWLGLAAQVLVGMPEHALYSGVFASLWLIFRSSSLRWRERAVRIVLLGCGALALSAPQLLTTLSYVAATTRAGSPAAAELGSLWVHTAFGFLVPGLGSGTTCFLGIATLALAAASFAKPRTGSLPLLSIATVAFLLSLGPQVGLYGWFHRIPPFDRFRAPVKLYPYAEFSVVWAAALGMDALLRRRGPWRTLAAALACLAIVEHVAFFASDDREVLESIYRTAPRPDVVDRLAAVGALRAHRPDAPPPLVLDMGPPLGGGYAGSLGALIGVASLHAGGVSLLAQPHSELLYGPLNPSMATLFGVRYAVVPTDRCAFTVARWRWPSIYGGDDFCVLANGSPAEPFTLVTSARAVDSIESMLQAVRGGPPGAVPVVAPLDAVADLHPGSVVVRDYAPGRIRLRTTSAGRSLLLVRQSFVPGWRIDVDGVRTTAYPAAGLYFAVPVGAGTHTVALDYRASGLRTGALIALAWTALAAVGTAWRR